MAKAAQTTARSSARGARTARTSRKNEPEKLNTGFFSLIMIALTLITLIMLIWPSDEYSPLHTLKGFLSGLFGSLTWTLPVVFALGGYFAYRSDGKKSLLTRFLFAVSALYLLFLTTVEAFCVDSIASGMGISTSYVNFLSFAYRAHTGGGLFGALLAWPLHSFMGAWGALILCLFAATIILFGTGAFSLENMVHKLSDLSRKSPEGEEEDEENEEERPRAVKKPVRPSERPTPEKRRDKTGDARRPDGKKARPAGEKRRPGAKKPPDDEKRSSAAPELRRKPAGKDVFEIRPTRSKKKERSIYDEALIDDFDIDTAASVRLPNFNRPERTHRSVLRNDEEAFEIPKVFEDETDPYSEFFDRPARKKKKPAAPKAEERPKKPAAPRAGERPKKSVARKEEAPRKKAAARIEEIDLLEAVRNDDPEERNRRYVKSALSDHSKKPKPVLGYSIPRERDDVIRTRPLTDNSVIHENLPEINALLSDEPPRRAPVKPASDEKPKAPAPSAKAPAPSERAPEPAPKPSAKEPPAPKPSFFDAGMPEKKPEYVPQTRLPGMKENLPVEEYMYPPIDLMETSGKPAARDGYDPADLERAERLVETLKSFSIPVKITGISHGPAVTRFELLPAPGIKVSKIASYADDIAMNLAAESVRIEAPIPGKSAVGVELPNLKKEMVHLRDVLESVEAQKAASRLAVALGKDNSGKYIVADLASMPHVLIAGQTGSGKSVCINAIIISILYRSTPEEVRMIMIDPKMVELNAYNTIPHLLVPVVTDPKKAASALDWAVGEMTRRYKEFSTHGAKNIQSYNKKLAEGEKPMPQIVIIVDELADLMMTAPHDVEDAINRLAQLARAAGMHLVIATQRPSVNVITGVIKANIPTRIAFTVASGVDSRTILDSYGAESLLGKGDMLYLPPDRNKPLRIQGAWVSEDEVQAVVDYVSAGSDTNFDEDILEHMENAVLSDAEKADKQKEEADDQVDELFAIAVKAVIDNGQASISMLQRKLRVGYARAGRLIDDMAQRGFVSQSEGSKSREVLITREQYLELFGDSAE